MTYKKRILITPILFLIAFTNLFGIPRQGPHTIIDFELEFDQENQFKFFANVLHFGIISKTQSGKTKRTIGWSRGLQAWKQWNIQASLGRVQEGMLYFERKELVANQYKIHLRISPKNNPQLVKDFEIEIPHLIEYHFMYDEQASMLPGQYLHFTIEGIYSNGKRFKINQLRKNTPLESYTLHSQPASPYISLDSILIPNPASGHQLLDTFAIQINHQFDTQLSQALRIPLNYRGEFLFDFNGLAGRNGPTGAAGGLIGRDGGPGKKGYEGQKVKVYARQISHPTLDLIEVKAISEQKQAYQLFNAQGSQLIIQANGGNGGAGGKGGSACDTEVKGGSGGIRTLRGSGGMGGYGGDGGKGGSIEVWVEEGAFDAFQQCVQLENKGGKAGPGGKGGNVYHDSILVTIVRGGPRTNSSSGLAGEAGDNGPAVTIKVASREEIQSFFDE